MALWLLGFCAALAVFLLLLYLIVFREATPRKKAKEEDGDAADHDRPLNQEPWCPQLEVKNWKEVGLFDGCPWSFDGCGSAQEVVERIWKVPVCKGLQGGHEALLSRVKEVLVARVQLVVPKEVYFCVIYQLANGSELFGGPPTEHT
ncbi:unnamed protein product, partial [Polarella glacialis]